MTQTQDHRWVKTVTLSPPSLEDNTADADRLEAALKKAMGTRAVRMDLNLSKQLPERLREWNYRAPVSPDLSDFQHPSFHKL